MRGVVKAAILLLGPAVGHALPTHREDYNAATEDPSVAWWQDIDGVLIKFHASCAGCPPENSDWSVELGVTYADAVCGNAIVTVNGRELLHQWDGSNGSGSGLIPRSPSFEAAAASELPATWRSICVPAPAGASNNYSAQVLAVALDLDAQQRQGFTVSFTPAKPLEILRLSAIPVEIPQDDTGLQAWREPDITNRLPNRESEIVTALLTEAGRSPLEDQIEAELQRLSLLRQELHRIRHSVRLQKVKIHSLLRQDCQSVLSKWQQCEDFRCVLRTSWQTIPEIFRSISYRLGRLESKKLTPICNSRSPGDFRNNTDVPSPPASWRPLPTTPPSYPPVQSSTASATTTLIQFHPTELPTPIFTEVPGIEIPSYTTPASRPTPTFAWLDRSGVGIEIPLEYQVKRFFRSFAIFLLIIAISALIRRVILKSSAYRRRRRDLAARQEERRARRGYNNAARRLRWRQWWEGGSYSQTQSVYSAHSLPEANPIAAADQPHEGTLPEYEEREEESPEESGHMQNEILGLRRVLEYVGQLVHTNDDPNRRHRPRSRSFPPRYEEINDTRSSGTRMTAVETSGMNSPRPSSFVSLDTGSLMTLDTLDTLDSAVAPPSYRT